MWDQLVSGDARIIDLSIGLEDGPVSEPIPPGIDAQDHEEGAAVLAGYLQGMGHDVEAEDFPEGMGLATETVNAITHAGTHMDAPWHFGPEVDGEPAKTIGEVPLSWGVGDAIVLDFTWKEPRTEITPEELREGFDELGCEPGPENVVLVETGADELWGTPEYLTEFPGMSAGGVEYLVEQGVTVVGTDAYGFDKPFDEMGRRFAETGDPGELWPAHFAGRDVEYTHIEKLANLDELPRRTDIPFLAIPTKVEDGSAGWVRPVAIVEDP